MALAASAAGVDRPARAGIAYILTDLGTLGGCSSAGFAVNDAGQVAGYSYTTSGAQHAFLSGPAGGQLKDLGTLGGSSSVGTAVNASGQVAGAADTAGGAIHAFLSGPAGGALKDLGTLGGDFSSGIAVNAAGQVVGASDLTVGGLPQAFLYSGGQMLDLNDLIAPGSGFTLAQANGISDTAYIAGYGTAANGQTHAFLLTPRARAVRPGAARDRGRRPAGLPGRFRPRIFLFPS
jgi:probable HAF family extracellular repeat protein